MKLTRIEHLLSTLVEDQKISMKLLRATLSLLEKREERYRKAEDLRAKREARYVAREKRLAAAETRKQIDSLYRERS